ncbi:response regulator transcription factor [Paenibacillus xylanilyticus]|uniref:response regulator transcription factor n=1 Tax=Paenibacillus xylanilyticus TaxID=248903 RepID=UPI0039A281B4
MNLTAMLVDDELPILENLSLILPWEDMGIEITGTARSGVEALDKVAECHPDIMLCDIRMPTMDGLELIRILRERGESCEIILLTGYQQFEYARTAIRYNVHEYICKPIDYLSLENKLRELTEQIHKKRMASESERHRNVEMENWIRQKQVTDLLAGEKKMSMGYPAQAPEQLASSVRYILILVDVEGYFRYSIGWSSDQHQQWHDEILSSLRVLTEEMEGSMIISVRKGEWGVLLEASGGWEFQSDEIAQRILLKLDAMFAADSAMKVRIVQDATPVCLDQQIAERYRHCQRMLMNPSDNRDDIRSVTTSVSSRLQPNEATKKAAWITREELELFTRWIRQGNKQELVHLLHSLKQRLSQLEVSSDSIGESNIRFLLVHMLRELREVDAIAEQEEKQFWDALQMAASMKELVELTEAIAHAWHSKQGASRPSVSELVKSACEYMDTRLEQDLGIDEVADWLGISSSYFCQLFKSHVGVTFVEYMTHKRMESAALLLSTTEWSITAIGEATGYKERRYFSKVFHKHFHMKPSEYRQSKRTGT